MKDLAKMRETEEKIQRAKEAQEKREREKKEKAARKKALVDITAGMPELFRFSLVFVLSYLRKAHAKIVQIVVVVKALFHSCPKWLLSERQLYICS